MSLGVGEARKRTWKTCQLVLNPSDFGSVAALPTEVLVTLLIVMPRLVKTWPKVSASVGVWQMQQCYCQSCQNRWGGCGEMNQLLMGIFKSFKLVIPSNT